MRGSQKRKQDVYFVNRSADSTHLGSPYIYTKPIKKRMSVSPTAGSMYSSYFGQIPAYDRYLITYEHDFLPKEGTLVYVDKTPELDTQGNLVIGENGEPTVKPDYSVAKIGWTKNGVTTRIGITKIDDIDDEEEEEQPDDPVDDDEDINFG